MHFNNNGRKISRISQIRNIRNVIVTDVSEKANIFNNFFGAQCSLLETGSILSPETQKTDKRLEGMIIDEAKGSAIIRTLDLNKAHGWDDISVRMVKLSGESLVRPLVNIFNFSLNSGVFPNNWKKGKIVPNYKKGDKSFAKNYRPVSLLPMFSKMFEKCLYDELYSYFETNNLFSPSQSAFRKGDSCISQFLSITHDIFKGFDANPPLDTRGVFLDISKAVDRVWHKGLIFKLKSYGISGNFIENFLSGRQQRVACPIVKVLITAPGRNIESS